MTSDPTEHPGALQTDEGNNDGPIVSLHGIGLSFGKQKILDGIDLEVPRGQTAVVLGRSGVGKSVLLKVIVRLLKPDAGRVLFDGADITGMTEGQLAGVRTRMGMLFQGAALFDSMSVYENVAFGLRESRRFGDDEIDEIVRQQLDRVEMLDAAEKLPLELSGGMKKRVALARALAMDPQVLLYDEPTSGLDPVTADNINRLICRTAEETGATSIVVTHDMASAMKVGDRFLLLNEGKFVFDGTQQQVIDCDNPKICRFKEGRSDTFDDLPGDPRQ